MPARSKLQFTSTLEQSENKLWGCHFRVPGSIVKKLIDGKSRRVICSLNDSVEYQCALIPNGNGTYVITVNRRLRDSLELSFGMTVKISLKKDESKYGLPMPAELEELFRQDTEARELFHALTVGRQRTLLYIIGKAKEPDGRVSKALIITNHLKTNAGKINYKQLSHALGRRWH